jgi:hypothetical protein
MFNLGPKNGLSNADNNKDEMHPQDMRNMFIFFIAATILYFTYDAFILKPQAAQIKARAKVEAALIKEHGPEVLKDLTQIVKKQPREEIISTGGRVEFDNGEVVLFLLKVGALMICHCVNISKRWKRRKTSTCCPHVAVSTHEQSIMVGLHKTVQ